MNGVSESLVLEWPISHAAVLYHAFEAALAEAADRLSESANTAACSAQSVPPCCVHGILLAKADPPDALAVCSLMICHNVGPEVATDFRLQHGRLAFKLTSVIRTAASSLPKSSCVART